jgi:hypothetical protein
MEEKRPLRRWPDDHNFGSFLMLAVTAGAFLLVTWVATKDLFFFLQGPGRTRQPLHGSQEVGYGRSSRQPTCEG